MAVGFASGEGFENLTGTLSHGGSSQGAIEPGMYEITVFGVSSSNYAIRFVDGVLQINAPIVAFSQSVETSGNAVARTEINRCGGASECVDFTPPDSGATSL